MAEEAESGLFVFGVWHFVEELELVGIEMVIEVTGLRQMWETRRIGRGCVFLARARIWGIVSSFHICRDQVLELH